MSIGRQVDLRRGHPTPGTSEKTLEPGAQQSPGQKAKNSAAEHTSPGGAKGPFGTGYTGGGGK